LASVQLYTVGRSPNLQTATSELVTNDMMRRFFLFSIAQYMHFSHIQLDDRSHVIRVSVHPAVWCCTIIISSTGAAVEPQPENTF